MEQFNLGLLFEKIVIDFGGLFPTRTSNKKYILVATDYFSTLPEACAMPNQKVSMVPQVFIDNWYAHFGV